MQDAALTREVRTLHALATVDYARASAWATAWRPRARPPYRLRLPRPSELQGVDCPERAPDDPPALVAEWVHRFELEQPADPAVTTVWASTLWPRPDADLVLPSVVLGSDRALYGRFQVEAPPALTRAQR